MPRVTVVIPCFNHGRYVDEAVDCVLGQTFHDLELFIVDDGSTDPETVAKLSAYRRERTTVIRTENRGLSAARNRGIEAGTGEYVFPLDADDRIGPTYIEQAVRVLDADPRIGLVYCEGEHFGARTDHMDLAPFSEREILWENMIFCSALYRRSDWQAVGGYRSAMRQGWEDWDFWLALVERGCGVHRLADTLFFYRVAIRSMHRDLMKDRERMAVLSRVIHAGHVRLYARNAPDVFRRRAEFLGQEDIAARIALRAMTAPSPVAGFPARLWSGFKLLLWSVRSRLRRRGGPPSSR